MDIEMSQLLKKIIREILPGIRITDIEKTGNCLFVPFRQLKMSRACGL